MFIIFIVMQNLITKTHIELGKTPESFDERKRIILSFQVFNIPESIQTDILNAYDYFKLHPEQFDGSTGSPESWVSLYEPPSMVHDLDYITYGGTYEGRLYADLKFLNYKKRYMTSSIWRNIQYFAVRWGGFYYQIKNRRKGNTKKAPSVNLPFRNKRTFVQLLVESLGIITIIPFLIFFIGAWIIDLNTKPTKEIKKLMRKM
ncbi:hypothetical protein BPT24_016 [Tenacibaculum phage pT24]|uniref:Uncharacterized protein n=1 Tax=Tenacibaculum phage pT24 TaxID=1880590 RepID=A0A1B4XWE2_9CAUD|nr:hypothetical protein HYP10_gp016 [Tenacibaculum phage pT24]BAV39138.1 hypothetical protein BPT24_016 [Tenacibaculum phage pT24]